MPRSFPGPGSRSWARCVHLFLKCLEVLPHEAANKVFLVQEGECSPVNANIRPLHLGDCLPDVIILHRSASSLGNGQKITVRGFVVNHPVMSVPGAGESDNYEPASVEFVVN